MFARLVKNSDFLRTILRGSRLQAEAVLLTASDHVWAKLSLTCHAFRLSKKANELVTKFRKVLRIIGDLSLKVKDKLVVVQKFAKKILSILMSVLTRLLSLIDPKQ